MKTILVTGSNGLLGQKIIYALRNRADVKCISTSKGENRMKERSGYIYQELDITNQSDVYNIFEMYKPDAVINTAAMTNVDACELQREEAWLLNVQSVQSIINACSMHQSHLVHLSTDFVFDGRSGPYVETDEPNPLSFYAHSKYEAEKLILTSSVSASIIRTIIIYGVVDDNSRSNVVLWAKNALENKKQITVINDQFRSPTLAEDLAKACITAAIKKSKGIYHIKNIHYFSSTDMIYSFGFFYCRGDTCFC